MYNHGEQSTPTWISGDYFSSHASANLLSSLYISALFAFTAVVVMETCDKQTTDARGAPSREKYGAVRGALAEETARDLPLSGCREVRKKMRFLRRRYLKSEQVSWVSAIHGNAFAHDKLYTAMYGISSVFLCIDSLVCLLAFFPSCARAAPCREADEAREREYAAAATIQSWFRGCRLRAYLQ